MEKNSTESVKNFLYGMYSFVSNCPWTWNLSFYYIDTWKRKSKSKNLPTDLEKYVTIHGTATEQGTVRIFSDGEYFACVVTNCDDIGDPVWIGVKREELSIEVKTNIFDAIYSTTGGKSFLHNKKKYNWVEEKQDDEEVSYQYGDVECLKSFIEDGENGIYDEGFCSDNIEEIVNSGNAEYYLLIPDDNEGDNYHGSDFSIFAVVYNNKVVYWRSHED